ncbi:hypothetical protein CMZ82_13115 [Lysobacteraceae bacterium NML93-0792]|nr:hypothetical protein CMZ82_13115 [Xanthomonadaceae bacterium NML93-0792]PBS14796.1 hypothetical protein CMZ81_13960 [Xanthomonadaceae bacterium NML93-0793]
MSTCRLRIAHRTDRSARTFPPHCCDADGNGDRWASGSRAARRMACAGCRAGCRAREPGRLAGSADVAALVRDGSRPRCSGHPAMRRTVLLITTSYPGEQPGSEAAGAFVADLARALQPFIDVRVVAPGPSETRERTPDGLEVYRFSAGDRPLSLLSPLRPWHWPRILGALRSLRRQALAANGDRRLAHTLALWLLPSGWAARSLLRQHGVPYSTWALGSDIWSLGRLPGVRRMLAAVGKGASAAYADGHVLARDAQRVCGRPFEFLPSARALEVVRTDPVRAAPPYRYLFLGRWHPNKGVDLLLDALELLRDDDWRSIGEVHIAGGGPMEDRVRSHIMRLQLASRPVRLSGFLGTVEAANALADSDRLLLPSRIESIPVVFSDAMTAGVPVVSMPVGDLPALVQPGLGWLSAGVEPAAFADAIRASFEGRIDADAITACARAFHPSTTARRLLDDWEVAA